MKQDDEKSHQLALMSIAVPQPLGSRQSQALLNATVPPMLGRDKAFQVLNEIVPALDVSSVGETSAERRARIYRDPDILLTWVEMGYQETAISRVLGYPSVVAYRSWLRAIGLYERVQEAELAQADVFAAMATAAYDPVIDAVDSAREVADLAGAFTQAAVGDMATLEHLLTVYDAGSEGHDSSTGMVWAAVNTERMSALHVVRTRQADMALKLADKLSSAAARMAAWRNPSRYGAGSSGGSGGSVVPQQVSINMNFGSGEKREVKVVNAEPMSNSLPPGIDLG